MNIISPGSCQVILLIVLENLNKKTLDFGLVFLPDIFFKEFCFYFFNILFLLGTQIRTMWRNLQYGISFCKYFRVTEYKQCILFLLLFPWKLCQQLIGWEASVKGKEGRKKEKEKEKGRVIIYLKSSLPWKFLSSPDNLRRRRGKKKTKRIERGKMLDKGVVVGEKWVYITRIPLHPLFITIFKCYLFYFYPSHWPTPPPLFKGYLVFITSCSSSQSLCLKDFNLKK